MLIIVKGNADDGADFMIDPDVTPSSLTLAATLLNQQAIEQIYAYTARKGQANEPDQPPA